MPSKTTLKVDVGADLYNFVKAAVATGGYSSASEVVQDALRQKRDNALRSLERMIEEGLESARRGELIDGDEVMRELRELSARRRAAARRRR